MEKQLSTNQYNKYYIFKKTYVCMIDFDTKVARGLASSDTFLCTTYKYLNSLSQQASNVFHYNCYLWRHNPLSYKYILHQCIAKWENYLMEALLSCFLHNLPQISAMIFLYRSINFHLVFFFLKAMVSYKGWAKPASRILICWFT